MGEAGRGGARFGRCRIAGVLVSYSAFAVLVGAATAVVAVLGIDADLTGREWRNAGNGVGIVAGILMFLAYLFGGYVSGRMVRRAGLINGLFVFIGGLGVAAATVAIVQAAGESGEAVDRLRESLANFGVPTSGSQWVPWEPWREWPPWPGCCWERHSGESSVSAGTPRWPGPRSTRKCGTTRVTSKIGTS